MIRGTFLDQMEHLRRQTAAEREITERTRAFTPEAMQQVKEACRAALARRPDDWQIHLSFGNVLADFGEHGPAANQFAAVAKAHPEFLPARVSLGQALWRAGQPAASVAEFKEILRIARDYQPAERALTELANPRPGR